MEESTTGLLECNYLAVLKGETYSQNVKCKVREWTDDVNIKNEFWFRHTVLLAASVSVYPVPLTQ